MNTQNLTKLSPIATVIDVSEDRKDKNDRTYRLLRVQGLSKAEEIHGGIVMTVNTPGRKVSITQYKESYLNGEKEPFFDAQPGDHVAIEIFQASNLEPYEIKDMETGEVRDVTTYTFPVVRGQNPVNVLNNKGLKFTGEEVVEAVEEVKEEHSIEQ